MPRFPVVRNPLKKKTFATPSDSVMLNILNEFPHRDLC